MKKYIANRILSKPCARDYHAINRFGTSKRPQKLTEDEFAEGLKICLQCYFDGKPYKHHHREFLRLKNAGIMTGKLYSLCKSCYRKRHESELHKRQIIKRNLKIKERNKT